MLRGLTGGSGSASNPVAQSLQDTTNGGAYDNGQSVLGGQGLGSAAGLGGVQGLGGNQGGGLIGSQPSSLAGSNGNSGSSSRRSGGTGFSGPNIAVETAPDINAIVARGSPSAVNQIAQLVSQLDIRRPQVMIEAAIVEISGDVAEQFGVQLGVGKAATRGGLAATSFTNSGTSLQSILGLLGVSAPVGLVSDGLSVGVSVGDNFSILVQALAQSSKANLMSTPSLTTLDNQAAEIVVGQNVPFRTGTYTTGGNAVEPFTTIERQNVGISMRVLPRINDGDVIRLEITQEVSSLSDAVVPGAADLVTNRRSIQTTVLADNGGTIVLGGLITHDQTSADGKVPVVGDIPILGKLFSSESKKNTQRTLYVFLRPTILRDRLDVGYAAEEKYQRMREMDAKPQPKPADSLLLQKRFKSLPLEIQGIY